MRLPGLGLALAAAAAAATQASVGDRVKNVVIIGAGAAGSSAAYHLQKYAAEEGLPINITILEKTEHVGGRTVTVNAYDDPSLPVEQGASIFVTVNHILHNATRDFDLPLAGMSDNEPGDVTAIWNGDDIVWQSEEGSSWWWDVARMWWRYGLAPYRAVRLVKEVVGTFLHLYEEPHFPFRSLTQRAFELGLHKVTAVTGEQFLAEKNVKGGFTTDIMQAATRVNYASNLAHIHGLEAMVSFAAEGAIAVAGGNWQIFDKMVRASGASLLRNTTVASIAFTKDDAKPGDPRKYVLSTKDAGRQTAEAKELATAFDNVIIASPWQYSDIDAAEGVIKHRIDEIPYMKLHVTLFTSPFKLRPDFFKLAPGSKAPSNVYTTLGPNEKAKQGPDGVGKTGFYSISTLRRVVNPKTQKREFLYKIFSAEAVTPTFLSDILGARVPDTFLGPSKDDAASVEPISWYCPHWFHSYPIELPRVTFQDPILGRGLYYTSGIESFISTMETSALMGMNVARLIADDVAGKRLGKLIFGSSAQESLIELPQGQLYLVRPLSPKGYSELIFKDSAIRIRRTNQDFHYQLVVQRVFEEGEAELLAEEEGEDAEIDALAAERDEKTFLLDEALRFRAEFREGGEKVLAWRDLSGDTGDVYEFVCDAQVSESQVQQFVRAAKECQYERKYRKPHTTAADDDFEQFEFHEENPIPPASPLSSPTLTRSIESVDEMYKQRTPANSSAKRSDAVVADPVTPEKSVVKSAAASPEAPPKPIEIYAAVTAELHLFDPQPGHFVMVDDSVIATVSEVGKWEYWLQIDGKEKSWLGTPVVAEFNPVFDFEYLSFVFNHFSNDGSARSWLLRFKDQPTLENFQQAVMQAIWERLNETKWTKIQEKEREYVLDSFADLNMEDAPPVEEEEEEEERPDEEEDEGIRSEEYDSEEDEEAAEERKDGEVNSQLAVGYKHDRSFVFSTNISKVMTPKGKLMSPKKVMLHSEDRDMIIQNNIDPTKLYRMDLEYGKVVDEWNVHDDIPVVNFAPENKFAQMTGEQTFLGVSNNALYRNDFSALATTEKGYIAVASNKGDIRLFDPDGRWILGTTKNYLLLVDAQQKDGKNQGKLGFEKPFAADSKPHPKRLALTPEHVAQFYHETGKPISFTPAKFNTGEGTEETSIITATGPYIIEWNLKRVLRGVKGAYKIKRYVEEVKADDFKFGSDKNVIVALPNEVNMVAKQSLRKPTRESIIGNMPLGKDDIVNSPY
ncbi:high-affinity Zn(2+) transporter zrt1 [Purpureocillium lavendulum]|uniref:High-affinity Zn(2+) transporter zrt1 n=1 Tax=Purpureocillium lavendulum TaxID=1247861 RepID=A0AB34FQA1_9HYPO|nr:high-affinity Zn(2+) transporter zrt1 [Purpureocillium lavendulum]